MKKKKNEISYDDAAKVLDRSLRTVHRLIKAHGIKPIRYGHRTVRLPVEAIALLRVHLVLDLTSKN